MCVCVCVCVCGFEDGKVFGGHNLNKSETNRHLWKLNYRVLFISIHVLLWMGGLLFKWCCLMND